MYIHTRTCEHTPKASVSHLRYDHPHILAGQGTMGLEIVEQVPNIDAVVIPVGGGGLIAGVALAVKALYPHIQVIVRLDQMILFIFTKKIECLTWYGALLLLYCMQFIR